MKRIGIKALFTILSLMVVLSGLAQAADRFTSTATAERTVIEAQGTDRAKVKVYLVNSDYSAAGGGTIYAASERGDTEKFYEPASAVPKEPVVFGGKYYDFTDTDNDGIIEFEVASNIKGKTVIAVGLNNQVYDYVIGTSITNVDSAQIIGTIDLEFTAGEVKAVKLLQAENSNGLFTTAVMSGKYQLAGGQVTIANDIDNYKLSFQVVNQTGNPVSGQEVRFHVNQMNVRLDKGSVVSDEFGMAEVKVYSKEAFYSREAEVTAACENYQAVVQLNFNPTGPHTLGLHMSTPNNPILALHQTNKYFSFYTYDINENKIKYSSDASMTNDVSMEVTKQPDGSDIKPVLSRSMSYPRLTIPSFAKEGYYCIRLSLSNGNYLDVSFTVKKQGTVTGLKLEYEEKSIPQGGKTNIPKVWRVDAEGVEYEISLAEKNTDITFAFSNPNMAALVANQGGQFTATTDKDFLGELLITAIDTQNNVKAAQTMTICGEVTGVRLLPSDLTRPGEIAKLTLQTIDEKGNIAALGQSFAGPGLEFVVTEKPEGSNVETSTAGMFTTEIREDGVTDLEISCDKEGTVKLAVIVKSGATPKYTGLAAVRFGLKKANFTDEARMLLGIPVYYLDEQMKKTDAVPFLENNCFYVPLRALADIFAAGIRWNEETGEILLDNQERQVYLTVGSNIIKSNDFPPVMDEGSPQIIDGRTFVSFRMIGELFGALVEPIMDEANKMTGVRYRMY